LTSGDYQLEAFRRVCAFLEALFEHTDATVRGEFGDVDEADIPSEFRKIMTEGQTFQEPNSFRMKFYDEVIRRAKKILNTMEVLIYST